MGPSLLTRWPLYRCVWAGTKWGLTLYDVATRMEIETIGEHATWPRWSRHGESLFFIDTVDETHWWRYTKIEGKPEPIVSLNKSPVPLDGPGPRSVSTIP